MTSIAPVAGHGAEYVEVETFLLHQVYDLDGATCSVVSPTCLLWRRTTEGWKLALMESIPTTVT